MEIFKNRPFMLCCAVFLAFSLLGFCFQGWVKLLVLAFICAGLVTATVAVIFTKSRKLRINVTVIIVAAIMASAALLESYLYFDIFAVKLEERYNTTLEVEAVIISEDRTDVFESLYTVSVYSVDRESLEATAVLYCEHPAGLKPGQRVRFYAECVRLRDVAYNESSYMALISNGVTAAFLSSDYEVSGFETISEEYKNLATNIAELNQKLSSRLESGIGGEAGRISSAILLGNRYGLSNKTLRDFSRNGLSHMLALSGMHMAVITGFLELILRRLGCPRLIRCCIMLPAMFAYLALTGFSLSAIRAAVMLAAVYISFILEFRTDALTTLFITGAAIVAIMPFSIADIGFWMSFLATFGLLLIQPYISKMFRKSQKDALKIKVAKKLAKNILSTLLITLTANLSVLFVIWLCFKEISLMAPVSNLLCGFPVMLQLILSLIYLVVYRIPLLGEAVAWLTKCIGNYVVWVTGEISELRGIGLSLAYNFAGVIVIGFTVAMLVMLVIKVKHKICLFIPPAVLILSFAVCLTVSNLTGNDSLDVTYLKRGDREALVITQNGTGMICDMSDGYYSNLANAWEVAHDNAATEIEVLMLTHYHGRYRTSIDKFSSSVRLRSVWLPPPRTHSEFLIMKEIIRGAERKGISCTVYDYETELRIFGQGNITVSEYESFDRSVQVSNAFKVEYKNESLVYIGSSYLEKASEDKREELDGDILIYGTHGPNPELGYCIDNALDAREILFADEVLLELAYATRPLSPNVRISQGGEYRKFTIGY